MGKVNFTDALKREAMAQIIDRDYRVAEARPRRDLLPEPGGASRQPGRDQCKDRLQAQAGQLWR
jgi:hypothetical protein